MKNTIRIFLPLLFFNAKLFSQFSDKQIVVEVVVNADINESYKKWTTAEGIKLFLADSFHIEWKTGGAFEIFFVPQAPTGQKGSESCVILNMLPPYLFSFNWNAPPSFPVVRNHSHKTTVNLVFSKIDDNHTKINLIHSGWLEGKDWDEVFQYFEKAWPAVMSNYLSLFPLKQEYGEEYFIYTLKLDSMLLDPAKWTEEKTQQARSHFNHLKDQTKTGRVILAGRTTTEDVKMFGIVIYKAKNKEDAMLFMNSDPAIRHGLMTAECHPFKIALKN